MLLATFRPKSRIAPSRFLAADLSLSLRNVSIPLATDRTTREDTFVMRRPVSWYDFRPREYLYFFFFLVLSTTGVIGLSTGDSNVSSGRFSWAVIMFSLQPALKAAFFLAANDHNRNDNFSVRTITKLLCNLINYTHAIVHNAALTVSEPIH